MNDEIIRMAREAGCIPRRHPEYDNDVQVFATPDVLERFYNLIVQREREECAQIVWPKLKVWSEEELTAMTSAFNRAQEKHGWYETLMAVGASMLKMKAHEIRARGEKQ